MNLPDTDLYDTLQATRTVRDPAPEALAATRRRLADECRGTSRARAPRRARRWAVPLAAVTFLAGAGAAAWSATRQDPTTNTTIECGIDTYIPVETGDPIADCNAALARQERLVPPLVGWITPLGLVAVLPKGVAPPSGSIPLPPGFSVDRAVLYVGDVLADEATPIATACTTSADAAAFARSQLQLAGLVGWSVQVRAASPSDGCIGYAGFLDPGSRTATLFPIGLSTASTAEERLDEQLRAQLLSGPAASCDTSEQAATLVVQDAEQLGLAPADYAVNVASTVGAGARHCAYVTIDPAGSIQATIWQVPAAS